MSYIEKNKKHICSVNRCSLYDDFWEIMFQTFFHTCTFKLRIIIFLDKKWGNAAHAQNR